MSSAEKHAPKPPKLSKTPDRFLNNLLDLKETTEEKKNLLGLKVSTTTNGNMTQGIFFSYCEHFVTSLPPEQGKGGLPCILFLDGHVSRWNAAAMRYLILNNVFPFYLASHTTIWSQPNDNGPIRRLHLCIKEITVTQRRWNTAIIPYFNFIFMNGWSLFIDKENEDLLSGSNNATIAYSRIGFYPFDRLADGWEEAIQTLGIDKRLDTKRKENVQWEICVLSAKECRPEINIDEEKYLLTNWEFNDMDNEVSSIDALQSNLVIAKMRGDGVLARWR